MRNIRHHTIIITVNELKAIEQLKREIAELFKKNMEAKNGYQLISPVVPSLINNFYTFFISPDGSKEGYDLSDDGDKIRNMITDLLEKYQQNNPNCDVKFAEVLYGDDHMKAEVLKSN